MTIAIAKTRPVEERFPHVDMNTGLRYRVIKEPHWTHWGRQDTFYYHQWEPSGLRIKTRVYGRFGGSDVTFIRRVRKVGHWIKHPQSMHTPF